MDARAIIFRQFVAGADAVAGSPDFACDYQSSSRRVDDQLGRVDFVLYDAHR